MPPAGGTPACPQVGRSLVASTWQKAAMGSPDWGWSVAIRRNCFAKSISAAKSGTSVLSHLLEPCQRMEGPFSWPCFQFGVILDQGLRTSGTFCTGAGAQKTGLAIHVPGAWSARGVDSKLFTITLAWRNTSPRRCQPRCQISSMAPFAKAGFLRTPTAS